MENFDVIKERIRQSVSLVDVVAEHVTLRPSGRSFKGRCPFHHEKTPSFNVSPERGFFKCFGCNVGGDLFKFVQLIENVEFMDALRILADRAGIELPPPGAARSGPGAAGDDGPTKSEIARVNAWAAEVFQRQLRGSSPTDPGWAFLAEKKLSAETAGAFGLGLASADGSQLLQAAARASVNARWLEAAGLVAVGEQGDRYDVFRTRLMFPIRDATKRVIGFGGRTLSDARAKYINTAQNALFDKGTNLYGVDLARPAIAEWNAAIVVEGYTDCMAAHQHGFKNTVATLGTALTKDHARLLRRYCDEVVLIFDSDAAGDAAADRALAVALQHGLRVTLARVPEGKDPCEFLQLSGAEGFSHVLNSRCDALGFKWERTLARFHAQEGGRDRQLAMEEFAQLIADLGSIGGLGAIQRGLIINDIARTVSAPAEEIRRLLARAGQRRPVRAAARAGASGDQRRGGVSGAVVRDGEQAALMTVVEVVLAEPGLWSDVREVFDPRRFTDLRMRSIGERLREHASRPGGLDVGVLVSSIESTDEASLLTDLLFRGEGRESRAESLRSAVSRLERIRIARGARSMAQGIRGGEESEGEAGDATLRALGETYAHLAGGGQFVSRRAAEEYGAERGE